MAARLRVSFRASMLALLLTAGIAAPLLAGWLIYDDSRDAVIENAHRSLIVENAGKHGRITLWIATAREAVKMHAQLLQDTIDTLIPSIDGDLPELSRSFRHMTGASPLFREMFFIDGESGVIRASSNKDQVGKIREYENFFTEGRIGAHIEPPFHDLYYDDIVLIITAPLQGSTYKAFGVLGAYLNTGTISASLAQTPGTFDSSDTYLVNRNNLFVSTPSSVTEEERLRRGLHRPFLDDCREGMDGVATTTDIEGTPVYAAYSWLRVLEVCVVTQVARSEIATHLGDASGDALLVGGGVAFVILLVGVAVIVPINRALGRLRVGFGGFAGGDLSTRVGQTPFKEFDDIATSFNDMAAKHEAAASELVRARDAADHASEAKSRFVAAMSHEIRTPLNGVLGLIAIANERQTPEEVRKDLESAAVAGEQLLFVVNQILDFSKIEAGKFTLSEESFDPATVLQSVASVMAPQAAGKGLNFKLDIPMEGAPPVLLGDPGRLRQVIFNLIGNAVKFTEVGRVTLTVRYDDIDDGRVAMSVDVLDTGPGIEESFREKLFKEFEQADNAWTRKSGGTGLGLAIANRILLQMDSRMEVESVVGTGSRFHFRVVLPRGEAAALTPADASTVPTRPLRVLVTEDVAINRQVLRAFLEKRGHTVFEAANGQRCLDMLRAEENIDLILMDVQMPVMDGLAATRQIKLPVSGFAHVPVVGLTANAFEEQRREYMQAGMDDVLAKPIDWPLLEATLARVDRARRPTDPVVSPAVAAPAAPVVDTVPPDDEGEEDDGPELDTAQIDQLAEHVGVEATGSLIDISVAKCREVVWLLMQGEVSPSEVTFQAHTLKGVAGNIGLASLQELAARIETAGRAGGETEALIAVLGDTLDTQIAAVERYCSTLRGAAE